MITSKRNREQLDRQRTAAAGFFIKKFSREERILIFLARDLEIYLQAETYLQTDEARKFQKFYDFQECFADLKNRMKEFRWSKEFLLKNGIDFIRIKKLYHAVTRN